MSESTEALPPHLIENGQIAVPPRPIEGSTVHFHDGTRCCAAIVVNLVAEDPLDPDYKVDVVVFQPRRVPRAQELKFTKANAIPGNVRWANEMSYAPVEAAQKLTWHYPTAGCVPKVVQEV